MPLRSIRLHALAMTAFAIALLFGSLASPLSAQERRAPQTAGVDKTKMGPYRALEHRGRRCCAARFFGTITALIFGG